MAINDEILAAYVDGTLPQNQVEEVRQYLATHPQEMEQVVKMMDNFPRETDEEKMAIGSMVCGICASPLAASGAAFVAKHILPTAAPKIRKANIQANLSNLLNEIF